MNCPTARRHLHPYLDDELELALSLQVLEHLNACEACERLFAGEEQVRGRYQQALAADRAPESLRAAVRRTTGPRPALQVRPRPNLVALAAGLVLATVLVIEFRHQRDVRSPGSDEPIAVTSAEGAVTPARPATEKVSVGPEQGELSLIALSQMLVEVLGTDPSIPNPLSMDGVAPLSHVAPEFAESPLIQSFLNRIGDRSLAVFRVDASFLPALNLSPATQVHRAQDASFVVKRCCGEHLLLVERGQDVFIVVSSSSNVLTRIFEGLRAGS